MTSRLRARRLNPRRQLLRLLVRLVLSLPSIALDAKLLALLATGLCVVARFLLLKHPR